LDEAKKGGGLCGLWSVNLHASQRAKLPAGQQIFFFFLRIPGHQVAALPQGGTKDPSQLPEENKQKTCVVTTLLGVIERSYYPYLATGATLRKEQETKVRWKKIRRVIAKKKTSFFCAAHCRDREYIE
jgi:hypothetical protein